MTHHADKTLTRFCHWQSELSGLHHDHAILLTGKDICSYSETPCDTLGKWFLNPFILWSQRWCLWWWWWWSPCYTTISHEDGDGASGGDDNICWSISNDDADSIHRLCPHSRNVQAVQELYYQWRYWSGHGIHHSSRGRTQVSNTLYLLLICKTLWRENWLTMI